MTTRYSIVMSEEDTKILKKLAHGMHKHAKAELIRKAIRLYSVLKEKKEKGQFAIVDEEGKVVEILVILDV